MNTGHETMTATGTGPVMGSGTDPIMVSWPVDGFETVMNILSSLHSTVEQFLATCSPWGTIVRKNYDRTPAAFSGVGPI